MITEPLFVAFGTPDYEWHLSELAHTLQEFRLAHEIHYVPCLKDWNLNAQHKAVVIASCLEKHDRPIVYLDADARVKQKPVRFWGLDADFAAHWREYRHGELLSGTLYFEPTDAARKLVAGWIQTNADCPRKWDQLNLSRCVEGFRAGLRIKELPASYCSIFDAKDMHDKEHPPVIEHLQASRQLKSKVRT